MPYDEPHRGIPERDEEHRGTKFWQVLAVTSIPTKWLKRVLNVQIYFFFKVDRICNTDRAASEVIAGMYLHTTVPF